MNTVRDRSTDHLAAIDALYRFGAGQDLHDEALFASAFTQDAELDFRQPAKRLGLDLSPFLGRETIVGNIMATVERLDTTHTVTNPRVTLDGDKAEMFALVDAYHLPRADHSRHLQLKNIYRISLMRADSEWRIARMVIHNVWMTGDPAVLFG